ncbi:hypothetical protein BA059_16650 [Mycolicibacterium sp. (ex Dasyatis americana)]|nr:hypothetical protein BA059_16650 [Mycolicibacterium sp. (ex Dasyatis americana)]
MTTPAGWYPDNTGATRYWDGRQWTTHTMAPTMATAREGRTVNYGFAFLAGISAVITLLPALGLIGTAFSSDDTETTGAGIGMTVAWLAWGGFWTVLWALFAISNTRARR